MTQLDLFQSTPPVSKTPLVIALPDRSYDAILRLGRLAGDFIDRRIHGRVYADTLTTGNHPFPDGYLVSTSPAVSYIDGILLTLSGTRYRVEIDQ